MSPVMEVTRKIQKGEKEVGKATRGLGGIWEGGGEVAKKKQYPSNVVAICYENRRSIIGKRQNIFKKS